MGSPNDETMKGIIPRTFGHIMNVIETNSQKNFLLRCSYLEVYNEEIHDLLSSDIRMRYELKEYPDKGIFVKDLTMSIVKSIAELEKLMTIGSKNRSTGETLMNKESSRSHSIFSIYLETSESLENDNTRITAGKLNLVDLAGCERQSKTEATGTRLKEASQINLSLSALGNVISALVDGKSSHIPYRDSKLTRLLQDSLGGNTKTVMIACISPSSYNYDEILGTLRYASRAKNIQNKPTVNEDPKDALLKAYADEIQKLKSLLSQQGGIPLQHDNGIKQQSNSNGNSENKTNLNGFSEEKHRILNEDKEKVEQELRVKNEQLTNEKKEKENLEKLVKEFQDKLFIGQHNQENDAKSKEYEALKKKIKNQKKLEEKLILDKKLKEQEVIKAEKKYQNLNEEVEALRTKNNEMAENLKNALSEIKDLQLEQEVEREDLLQTIRVIEQDNKLLTKVLGNILNVGELEKIKNRAQWNDDNREFKIKPFVLKEKTISFPKLSLKKSYFVFSIFY